VSELAETLRGALERAVDSPVTSATRVHGGDVSIAYRLQTGDGRTVFAKTHSSPPPNFFSTEAAGLRWLGAAGAVAVPDVIAVSDDPAFLVLEWIDEGGRRAGGHDRTERDLGVGLARLHAAGAPSFGREDRRTTGSRALPNDPCDTWVEFYADRRLRPLARLASDGAALADGSIRRLERLAGRLDLVAGPAEPPARLHGDLWAGNRLVAGDGRNWLIDPAAHGGHREFDLAMMRLFGGFSAACFDAYADVTPLADGWQERVALHQIAPLVVHAIKFGGGYVAAAESAIGRYA
jgi:fructosamine-3-kinase